MIIHLFVLKISLLILSFWCYCSCESLIVLIIVQVIAVIAAFKIIQSIILVVKLLFIAPVRHVFLRSRHWATMIV